MAYRTPTVSSLSDYITLCAAMVPVENDIPVGRYSISLTFTNEGYSKRTEDVFTVIVR